MNKSDIVMLFEYNHWANTHILESARQLTPAQFSTPASLSHGSLRSTLVHTLGVEILWRQRCQEGLSPTSILAEANFPNLEQLRDRWRSEEKSLSAYLAALTEADLQGVVHYKNTKGIPYQETLWKILAHVVNHGTQTRSEAAIALTAYG
jgi:uncharacterized damage-inducible protein DinB